MFDAPEYSWYNAEEIAKTETGVPENADLRIPSGQHEFVTRCSARLPTNNFEQSQCKWYKLGSGTDDRGNKRCMYDKWGYICDKLVIKEKGIN